MSHMNYIWGKTRAYPMLDDQSLAHGGVFDQFFTTCRRIVPDSRTTPGGRPFWPHSGLQDGRYAYSPLIPLPKFFVTESVALESKQIRVPRVNTRSQILLIPLVIPGIKKGTNRTFQVGFCQPHSLLNDMSSSNTQPGVFNIHDNRDP